MARPGWTLRLGRWPNEGTFDAFAGWCQGPTELAPRTRTPWSVAGLFGSGLSKLVLARKSPCLQCSLDIEPSCVRAHGGVASDYGLHTLNFRDAHRACQRAEVP